MGTLPLAARLSHQPVGWQYVFIITVKMTSATRRGDRAVICTTPV